MRSTRRAKSGESTTSKVNMDGTAFWLWTEKDGLRRFPLSGVAQHDMFVSARFVGGCS